MGKKKIVLDTNIFISALGFNGPEKEILEKCIRGEFTLYYSNPILQELSRVLEYPKFNFSEAQKDALKLIIGEIGCLVNSGLEFNIEIDDPSDKIFIEVAIVSGSDFLVTGDKHLLKIRNIGKTSIVKSSEFLKSCK